jgi:hypothetical protein
MAAYPFNNAVKFLRKVREDMHEDRNFLRYAFGIVSNIIDWPAVGFQQGQQSFGFQKGVLIPKTHDWEASLLASEVPKDQAFEIDMPYQVSTDREGSIWIAFTSVGWQSNASDIRIRIEDVSDMDIILLCRNILAFVELEYVYRFLDAHHCRNEIMLPRIMATLVVERGWTLVSSRCSWSSYYAKYIQEYYFLN